MVHRVEIVDKENWRATPCTTGRLATEDDCRSGSAAFFLPIADGWQARPCDINLPKRARLTDLETGTSETVIVIQAEEFWRDSAVDFVDCLMGYRTVGGTFGVCSAGEITWIEGSSDGESNTQMT
jgi:hypothetical protein